MSTIKTKCDKCGTVYDVQPDKVGGQNLCSKCKAVFTVKTNGHHPDQSAPLTQANAGGSTGPAPQLKVRAAAPAQTPPKRSTTAAPDENQVRPSYTAPTAGDPNLSQPLPPNPGRASTGRQPHNRQPHNNHQPHNHQPHSHQTHNHQPHNHQPHNHQPHSHQPHSHQPHNHQPHSHQPHNRQPHNNNAAPLNRNPVAPHQGPAASGLAGSADNSLRWSNSFIINTRCPRCDFDFPISKGLLDKSVNCPSCKIPFFAADNYGWLKDPKGGFWSHMMSGKLFPCAMAGFFILLIALYIAVPKISDRLAESSLEQTLAETYFAPDYEISIKKITKNLDASLRVPKADKICFRYAVVNIVHQPSGMEFPRAMCHANGNWTPDFYQTVADKVAYERLDNPLADPVFDLEEMTGLVLSFQDDNGLDAFKAEMASLEVRMLETKAGPAIYNMSKLGHDEPSYNWLLQQGSFSIRTTPHYSVDNFIQQQGQGAIYKAHAVMYPDQVDELAARGLFSGSL